MKKNKNWVNWVFLCEFKSKEETMVMCSNSSGGDLEYSACPVLFYSYRQLSVNQLSPCMGEKRCLLRSSCQQGESNAELKWMLRRESTSCLWGMQARFQHQWKLRLTGHENQERPRHRMDINTGGEEAGPHPRDVCAGEKQITLTMGDNRRIDDGCDAVQLNSDSFLWERLLVLL